MINTLFVFLGILGFSYYYSIGAYFVLKKLGYEKVTNVRGGMSAY